MPSLSATTTVQIMIDVDVNIHTTRYRDNIKRDSGTETHNQHEPRTKPPLWVKFQSRPLLLLTDQFACQASFCLKKHAQTLSSHELCSCYHHCSQKASSCPQKNDLSYKNTLSSSEEAASSYTFPHSSLAQLLSQHRCNTSRLKKVPKNVQSKSTRRTEHKATAALQKHRCCRIVRQSHSPKKPGASRRNPCDVAMGRRLQLQHSS
jgi:hypothetical protein